MIVRGDIFGSHITLLEAASRGSLSSLADKEKPPALPMTSDRLLITQKPRTRSERVRYPMRFLVVALRNGFDKTINNGKVNSRGITVPMHQVYLG